METISRISSMLETARELTLEAAQSASSAKLAKPNYPARSLTVSHIKKLLDSRNDREVLDGMRRVISLMYRSEPCLPFFSAVVKNVANSNIEVKKLVYIYLLHHAEAEPDLALLSINAIQKSLTDQNPQVRSMALRTMSGIRVPVVSQIVSLAIKRGCGDMSPHVRKAAALAIPKCYRLDPNTLPQLVGCVSTLLGDAQYFVVGPAVAAFLDVCPDRIDLIHKNYHNLVRKLVDMDEWSQLATLRLLTIYGRKCFPRKTEKVRKKVDKGFYEEEDPQDQGEETGEEVTVLDRDLELFLRACKPLLQSRNSAVILSVVRCFLYLGTTEYLESAIGPLVALVRSPQDIQHVALYNIVAVALEAPKSFARYAYHFLVHDADPPHIWRLKLEVLTVIFPYCGMHLKGVIIGELEHFARGPDVDLVKESVRAIGRCAQSDSRTGDHCLSVLLSLVTSPDEALVSESLTVIRHLIQQDPQSHKNTIIQLAKSLDTTTSPEARASIIWLVGEFASNESENGIAPDVLRILVRGFADESEITKQQIVLLGAKVYLHHLLQKYPQSEAKPPQEIKPPVEGIHNEWTDTQDQEQQEQQNGDAPEKQPEQEDNLTLLWRYILLLARYDTSYDLRDRARLYKALLADPSSTQLASLLLLAPKPVPHAPSPSETRKNLLIGSSTLVVGPEAGVHGLSGYESIPDWVESGNEPDPRLREDAAKPEPTERTLTAGERLDKALKEHGTGIAARMRQNGAPAAAAAAARKNKSLDEWLADEEEESEEESEEEETGSEEEETESEEETDSEEEEETDSEEEEEETDSEDERETQGLMAGRGPSQSGI
ncbi:AP-3 complex subunit beta [Paecilomyces lecythidis]|uniref:AP-3 complex subunit beta n=1 Tax=Paecilomyces lecythidis TaxID=3004212 RepID=A0ABR3XG93_9EURO